MTDTELRLPVHCCCNPNQRFGTVPVRYLTVGCEPVPCSPQRFAVLTATGQPVRSFEAEVGSLHFVIAGDSPLHVQFQAVKSAHQPLSVWRQVPGFVEDSGDVYAEYSAAHAQV